MPTGYTHPVVDGKVTEFRDFALECARAFGALITLRDSPDAPIPEEFKVGEYEAARVATAKADLAKLEAMTDADVREASVRAHRDAIKSNNDYRERTRAENARLDAMLSKVRKWTPPTKDHDGLKAFMVEQLEMSRSDYEPTDPPLEAPHIWRANRRERLLRSLGQAVTDYDAAVVRAKEQTVWVSALRASL